MRLTKAHVLRVSRVVADNGPPAGAVLHSEAEYDEWVARIIAAHPDPGRKTRLFAYGSLIWKPEVAHDGEATAIASGWHRSFCFRAPRFRGTIDFPGLMMALDRGGSCRGVLYDLPRPDLEGQLGRLFRREFTVKPPNSMPRWITVEVGGVKTAALTFVMNRASPFYVGRLAPEAVAKVLARACGHWGSGAEYLFNTVSQLEARGIRDSGLWRLQQLVADEIERMEDDAVS